VGLKTWEYQMLMVPGPRKTTCHCPVLNGRITKRTGCVHGWLVGCPPCPALCPRRSPGGGAGAPSLASKACNDAASPHDPDPALRHLIIPSTEQTAICTYCTHEGRSCSSCSIGSDSPSIIRSRSLWGCGGHYRHP
jgi:hypothetical protein